eukprot:NODE_1117_length_603_cov_732.920578_g1043_i0.p1 GENE.NODE_1117_length_603_cov_732.920578_g1043_i0~~NODE_1117_length_603_cov_732.920578_g1043_i0.p1  ORF type:complete len:110 (-),score=44.93 NODE_1117_length_603_cov_732.920578_g1043_i0:148-477(-)
MGAKPGSLLKKIDAGKEGDAKTDKALDKLFNTYDKDKSGLLEGEEFSKLLNDVSKYVHDEVEAMAAGDQYDEEAVRAWVTQWMDPSGDGKCSLAEMKKGLQVVLDADGD